MPKIQKYYNANLKDFYVVFTKSEFWYQFFLKKHFGHVYILTHDQFNWISINPCRLCADITIMNYTQSQKAYLLSTTPKDRIIHIQMYQRESNWSFGLIGLRTCVSIAQYILGIKVRCITPWSFFKRLLRLKQSARSMYGIHKITLIR